MERFVVDNQGIPSIRIRRSASVISYMLCSNEAYVLLGRRSLRTSAKRSGWIDRPNSFFLYGAKVDGRVPRSKSSGLSTILSTLTAYCMARYMFVGLLPQRETPTNMTSAWYKPLTNWPSSWAKLKLIASIRALYCSEVTLLCERPTERLDFTPSARSICRTNAPKRSKKLHSAAPIIRAIRGSTKVLNTKGLLPLSWAHLVIRSATSWAFSTVSTKGIRTALNWNCWNCDKTEWLKVSAVIPVLSEMTKTVRSVSGSLISCGITLEEKTVQSKKINSALELPQGLFA